MGKVPWGSSSQIGTEMEAGLPDIKGTATYINSDGGSNLASEAYKDKGALFFGIYDHVGRFKADLEPGNSKRDLMFAASRSNKIYGASTTVQPPALCLLPCIRY